MNRIAQLLMVEGNELRGLSAIHNSGKEKSSDTANEAKVRYHNFAAT